MSGEMPLQRKCMQFCYWMFHVWWEITSNNPPIHAHVHLLYFHQFVIPHTTTASFASHDILWHKRNRHLSNLHEMQVSRKFTRYFSPKIYVLSSSSEIHMKIYMWNSREYNIYCDFQIKSTGSSSELFYESIIILPSCLVLHYNIYMLKKMEAGRFKPGLVKSTDNRHAHSLCYY